MPVSYNDEFIIPGPFLDLKKRFLSLEDGRKVGRGFELVLVGKFLPNKGSPNSSGTFSSSPTDEVVSETEFLTVMLKKHEALRALFSQDGKQLKIQGYDDGPALTCNPRVIEISEPRGNITSWAQLSDYQITLQAEQVYIDGSELTEDVDLGSNHIEKVDESWNIETLDEFQRTFRLTHQISAKGTTYFDPSGNLRLAWQNAQNYVLSSGVLGVDSTRLYASGVINGGIYSSGGSDVGVGLTPFNYLRSNNVNETAGTFSVVESWVCFDPGSGAYATDEFQVDTRESIDNGRVEVSVQGSIQGLELRNNSSYFTMLSDKWTNAQNKFNQIENYLHTRAENISGETLNPTPLQKVIGRNSIRGAINYNYTFNNRPEPITSGAKSEVISLSYENASDVFAEVPIVGQASGPLIQDMQTYTSTKKSLSVEIVVAPKTYGGSDPTKPNTNSLLTTYAPTGGTVKKSRDVENWSPTDGRYSRSVSWVWKV